LNYEQEFIENRNGDGMLDDEEGFPDDQGEWIDSDGDGVGDNKDTDEVAIDEKDSPGLSAMDDGGISDTGIISSGTNGDNTNRFENPAIFWGKKG
jgi:hypothetical protein